MSYARMDRDFWASEARERLGRDYQAVECWMWLWGSACASSLGVYRVPMRTLAAQLWCSSVDEARAVVARVYAAVGPLGAMRFDEATGDVWVVNCAKKQHDPIKAKDNRRYTQALVHDIEKAQRSPFWGAFFARYREHLLLDDADPRGWPANTPGGGVQTPLVDPSRRGENTPCEGVPEPLPKGCAHPAQPSPAQPIPENSSSSSFALDRTHTHATPLAAAALTPDHDPWPEQASRAAADAYIEIRRREGVEPYGDVCEPFERAALMLRDRLNIPAEKVSATLERIVRHASKNPAVRNAGRAGDLFRGTFYLLGNPSPKGAGVPMVDKLRRHLEDLAQHDARTAAPPLRHGAKRPTTWDDELQLSRLILTEEKFSAWLAAEVVPDTYGPDQLLYRPAGWDERAASAQVDEVGM